MARARPAALAAARASGSSAARTASAARSASWRSAPIAAMPARSRVASAAASRPRRLLGPAAADGDQGRADQDRGRGRRLGAGQEQAGRLLEVGLGGVEVAKAGLGAGQLGEGVGDAPADQLADDGQGLLVQLAGAFQVAADAGDAAQLVVEVAGPRRSPGPADQRGRLGVQGGRPGVVAPERDAGRRARRARPASPTAARRRGRRPARAS